MSINELIETGLSYQRSGDLERARDTFEKITALEDTNVIAHYSLASVFFNLGLFDKAFYHVERSIKLNDKFGLFYVTRAAIHEHRGNPEAAFFDRLKAAELSSEFDRSKFGNDLLDIVLPRNISVFINDDVLKDVKKTLEQCENLVVSGKVEDAIYLYRRYIATDAADRYITYFNLGTLYSTIGEDHAAWGCFKAVTQAAPDFLAGYLNMGLVLEKLDLKKHALEVWEMARARPKPRDAFNEDAYLKILNNLGRLYEIEREYEQSEAALYESLKLDGNQDGPLQHWLHLRQKQCKWPVLTNDAFCQKPLADMASPLAILSLSDDPAVQLACSQRFVRDRVQQYPRRVPTTKRYGHDKFRIGYASSDLSMHAVSLLTVELYELHDRSQFEVHAFCWSPEDGTPFRQRVKGAFDKFHAVGALTDDEIADRIQQNEIDVLVDLQGLSGRARPNIIAQGAAPIQIAYLGYPGTTAMPYVDYVIADDFIFPHSLAKDFSEKPIYLPRVFQVSDSKRQMGPPKRKSDFGISEDTFVFCCFNNNYKFNEKLFTIWLDIIKNTSNTVLWILEDNRWSKENLITLAAKNGVTEDRLVFAGRIDPRDYLARFQCADIFLDTYPYNAGTTANDLLWAGLPLLTLRGSTYVSRMAGSLVHCIGLDQLICHSHDEYRQKAIHFANNRDELTTIRQQLAHQKSALFDMKHIVSEYEEGIKTIVRG